MSETLQARVRPWMMACFGPEISADRIERNQRFIEEALELVQACGCTKVDARALVDYVYNRPQGDINREVGGVMITLAALCLANGFDMHAAGETELARIWTKVDQIRAKQAAKPHNSPYPAVPAPDVTGERVPIEGLGDAVARKLESMGVGASPGPPPVAGMETSEEEWAQWISDQEGEDSHHAIMKDSPLHRAGRDRDRLIAALAEARAGLEQEKRLRDLADACVDSLSRELAKRIAEARADAKKAREEGQK